MAYRTERIVDGEDREAAAKERMGRIGDLNLLDMCPLVWVIEVGIELMARSAAWTTSFCSRSFRRRSTTAASCG